MPCVASLSGGWSGSPVAGKALQLRGCLLRRGLDCSLILLGVVASMAYKLYLVARNEGLEYVDENGLYRFDISLVKGVWTIYLPGTVGRSHESRALSDEERARIFPLITNYLAKIRWLGLFTRYYEVKFVDRAEVGSRGPV